MKTALASWADLSSFHKIIVIIIYWTYNCHKYIHKGGAGAWNELPPSAAKPTALIAAINPWTRPFPLLSGYLKLASFIYCESALRSLVLKKLQDSYSLNGSPDCGCRNVAKQVWLRYVHQRFLRPWIKGGCCTCRCTPTADSVESLHILINSQKEVQDTLKIQ